MGSNSLNRFFAAFLALAFFFIFACSSGDGESGAMDGTWYKDDFELRISGKDYLLKFDGENETQGTVTYTDSTFEFIITQEWDGRKWIKFQGTARIFGNYARNGGVSVFSEVYSDYGYGTEREYMFDGEWRKR